MLSTFFLPAKSFRLTSFRSPPVRVNSGAVSPGLGKLPFTVTGLPPSVTLAIIVLLRVSLRFATLGDVDVSGRVEQGVELGSRFRPQAKKPRAIRVFVDLFR